MIEFGDVSMDHIDCSLEELFELRSTEISDLNALLKLKVDGTKILTNHRQGMTFLDNLDKIPSYVDLSNTDHNTIIIDQELVMSFFFNDDVSINKFIGQINNIEKGSIVDVVIDINRSDINVPLMDAGVAISNLIKMIDAKKIFNFGAEVSIPELMLAMCCDEVFVGQFASVSITKADKGDSIPRFMVNAYKSLVKNTYMYWMSMGLFTLEEINKLFESEAANSIQLLSDEIKQRITKQHTVE